MSRSSGPAADALAPTVGLIGFGAFGRLIARHLAPYLRILVHDPFVAEAIARPQPPDPTPSRKLPRAGAAASA